MASSWQGKSKATPLGYKIFLWLLQKGGLSAAYKLLPLVTAWYRYFMPSAIKPLQYLYTHRLHQDKKTTQQSIAKNLTLFGQSLLDKIAIVAGVPNNLTAKHQNFEAIERMKANGKGGILLSAHLGNWEAAGHLLQRYNWTVNILMYDGEAENIKQTLKDTNEKRSFNIISIQEDGQHIYDIKAALNRNELLCLNADRFRPGNRTYTTDFLGAPAQFPAGPFIMASKLNVPVSFTFAIKETDTNYIFTAYPEKIYSGSGEQGAKEMFQDFVKVLEYEVRKYPTQWFNYYPFWNEQNV